MIGSLLLLAVSGVLLGSAVYLLDGGGDEVDGTAVTGLAALALVALVLFLGGPKLHRQISKLGPGGVEFERGKAELALQVPAFFEGIERPGGFNYASLTEEQKFAYELGTQLILHQEHLGSSPDDFEPRQLRQYTDLVVRVGSWALREGEYQYRKALYFLRRLEALPDVPVEGYLLLGEAYRLAYWYQGRNLRHIEKAKEALEKGGKKDDKNASIHWSLVR